MFDISSAPQGYDGSSSSADDPIELDRIREWMDHHDWDSLDEPSEVRRDREICIQILLKNSVRTDSDFELHESANGSQQSSDESTKVAEESNPSVQGVPTEPPNQEERKPRFSAPQFLGVGAFGIVFSVRDELLGMDVAIKILRPSKSRSQELRARFIGEAQVTASLCHPSIVRVYETGQIGGLPYITSSKMDGGTLADHIAKAKPLSIRQAAWVVARISDSVQFAHSKAILHRDLKPSNILLKPCELGQSEQFGFEPMLTDFGLAKRLDQAGSSSNKTRDGRVLGTVRYMSPEQARGAHSEVGTASDVFSLGILLYQLLLGKVPFDDPLDQNIRTMISEKEPTRPRLVDKFVPADLEAVVLKCLAKEPAARYQTAHELWLDLQRYLNGQPVEAKPSTFLTRLGYTARTHPILTLATTLTIIVNLVALFGLYTAWTHERAALRVERVAREQERKAKEQVRISKEREREVLVGIVSIFSELGDFMQAGTRIKDEQWSVQLEKSSQILSRHCSDNPDDEQMFHFLSVLKHYLSSTYWTLGRNDESWRERLAVDAMLTKLIESNPSNQKYLYQSFFSRLLIGSRLVGDPVFRDANPDIDCRQVLDQALKQIEHLVSMEPENIDYRDAMAATELTVANSCFTHDPEHANPDRLLLIKHAVRGLALKARYHLAREEMLQARIAGQEAVSLFEAAWRVRIDERWAVLEALVVYDAWADILIANEDYEEALDALAECDRLREHFDKLFPIILESWLGKLSDESKRIKVYAALHDEPKRLEAESRMLSHIDAAKDIPGAIENLSRLDRELTFPVRVSSHIKALQSVVNHERVETHEKQNP